MEFAKCKLFTTHTAGSGMHLRQKTLAVYTKNAGSQRISDTATTTRSVLERRKLCSTLNWLWIRPSTNSDDDAVLRNR